MIISRTPFRISFFGGGTDHPAWYLTHGGSVLATSINKYCYITCRHLPPYFEHKIRLVYSQVENCHTIDEIAHPVVREVFRYLKIDRGIESHHDADLPARSGIGSSSSFTVGLLHALYALKGHMPSKQQLTEEGIHIEHKILKEPVGSQNQAQAAYGGINQIDFLQSGEISVRPLTISKERIGELESHLMLFYTGIKRTASDIAESYVSDIDKRKRQLRIMKDLVEESMVILNNGSDFTKFGELLHEAWQVKRSLSPAISNSHVDEIYDLAMSTGAIGGKLTGTGGGFMVLFVPPSRQNKVKERLNKLIHVPFQFDFFGSQIIFFDPEEDYSAEEVTRDNQPNRTFREMTELQNTEVEVPA